MSSDWDLAGDRTIFTTSGSYATEESACAAFDRLAEKDPRFSRVYPECWGRYAHQSPYEDETKPRIDRILIPSKALQNAGWLHGPIGVEIKRSGIKVAPPIAQCIDYLRASFCPDEKTMAGFFMPVGMVFLFPCPLIHHGLASVMAQHRVGNCQIGYEGRLDFQFAGKHVLSLSENERNFIPRRKVGSR